MRLKNVLYSAKTKNTCGRNSMHGSSAQNAFPLERMRNRTRHIITQLSTTIGRIPSHFLGMDSSASRLSLNSYGILISTVSSPNPKTRNILEHQSNKLSASFVISKYELYRNAFTSHRYRRNSSTPGWIPLDKFSSATARLARNTGKNKTMMRRHCNSETKGLRLQSEMDYQGLGEFMLKNQFAYQANALAKMVGHVNILAPNFHTAPEMTTTRRCMFLGCHEH